MFEDTEGRVDWEWEAEVAEAERLAALNGIPEWRIGSANAMLDLVADHPHIEIHLDDLRARFPLWPVYEA